MERKRKSQMIYFQRRREKYQFSTLSLSVPVTIFYISTSFRANKRERKKKFYQFKHIEKNIFINNFDLNIIRKKKAKYCPLNSLDIEIDVI